MPANYCPNCFCEATDNDGPCPRCHYDAADDFGKYPFALPHGSILAGQYITGCVLGQGGFGITYLAWDDRLKTKVAIKEFMPDNIAVRTASMPQVTVYTSHRQEFFQYGKERFLDEAKVLSRFQGNPNIVGVRSYFEENGTAYFVMDYIEGISFKSCIKERGGRISWQEAIRVLMPVMDALDAVHQEGIVHRDVTPDNIFLTAGGGVKLLDFGSARYSLGDKSQSLDVILKPGYAPKEQYTRRGKQGPFTDVYSLAACFYASVTGYLPTDSLERTESDDLLPPSARGADLPPALESVILHGLAVQPAERYQTMGEFRAAVNTAFEQGTVIPPANLPKPVETPEQKKKTSAVKITARIIGTLSTLLVLSFICFIGVLAFQYRHVTVTNMQCDDGIYTGRWSHGEPSGEGTMIYNDGGRYQGGWNIGWREGTGTMTYANGDVYEGEWHYDHKSGTGKMIYKSGDYYFGEWEFDYPTEGTMTHANGDIFEGTFDTIGDPLYGTMTYVNGDLYVGDWYIGRPEGTGTMRYANGDVYEGELWFGRPSGEGTMTYANGDVYKGGWGQTGKYDGIGTYTYANGDVITTHWQYGKASLDGWMTVVTLANGQSGHAVYVEDTLQLLPN